MTEEQAKARCRQLAVESPDRKTHSWIARESADGEWLVVKLAVPAPAMPETTMSRAADRQAAKDDPRSPMEQNFPPHGVGI